jgi:hypothetical protein
MPPSRAMGASVATRRAQLVEHCLKGCQRTLGTRLFDSRKVAGATVSTSDRSACTGRAFSGSSPIMSRSR